MQLACSCSTASFHCSTAPGKQCTRIVYETLEADHATTGNRERETCLVRTRPQPRSCLHPRACRASPRLITPRAPSGVTVVLARVSSLSGIARACTSAWPARTLSRCVPVDARLAAHLAARRGVPLVCLLRVPHACVALTHVADRPPGAADRPIVPQPDQVQSSPVKSSRVESSRVESSRVESSRVQSTQSRVELSQVTSSQVKTAHRVRREAHCWPA